MYDFSQGKVVATATLHDTGPHVHEPQSQNTNFHSFPCMPCIHQHDHHRDKIATNDGGININKMFNTAVARPVARKEMMENEEARKAMRKEWLGQHAAGVYDFSVVREYDDVVREAKRNGTEVHMARIHGICVEKNYQLPKGNPSRKFKGRGVLLGNQVKNQFWEAAFFQDLGNSPATFEASRWADFYGCLPGHGVKLEDAIQAYIQAVLTGPPCWVELPEDAWPDDIDFRKFRRPVVRLVKALYGHPDSGTMWEQHCDRKVRELDFVPVGEEWPSMYFHKKLQLLLVIYVDDLKLAGPEENLTKGWEMLRSKLNIEPETDLGLYLGCILSKGSSQTSWWYPGINYDLRHGRFVETVSWKVSWNCWERYKVETCIKHQVYQKKQRNTNQGHHVQGSQEEGILSLVFARIWSRRSGVLQTRDHRGRRLSWGVCTRRLGATCCQRANEVALRCQDRTVRLATVY